jgi:hypothetical protein
MGSNGFAILFTCLLYVKICSSRPRAEQHLVRWASSQLHDIESLSKMVDPSIQGQCSEKVLSRFADIISRCIQVIQFQSDIELTPCYSILSEGVLLLMSGLFIMQQVPEFRPPMSEIVQDLARIVNATGEESESETNNGGHVDVVTKSHVQILGR